MGKNSQNCYTNTNTEKIVKVNFLFMVMRRERIPKMLLKRVHRFPQVPIDSGMTFLLFQIFPQIAPSSQKSVSRSSLKKYLCNPTSPISRSHRCEVMRLVFDCRCDRGWMRSTGFEESKRPRKESDLKLPASSRNRSVGGARVGARWGPREGARGGARVGGAQGGARGGARCRGKNEIWSSLPAGGIGEYEERRKLGEFLT